MKHKHHIIPKHMGGSDDPSNLTELSREDHAFAHRELYEKYGKKEDLGAYYLLNGQTDEAMKIYSSLGGKVQGKRNAESGHIQKIQKSSDVVSNGRKGGCATIKTGKGSFANPDERKKVAVLGGKVQGKRNAESGHCKKITIDYWEKVKKGEIERSKKIWIYSEIYKISKLIKINDKLPDGFSYGRKIFKVEEEKYV